MGSAVLSIDGTLLAAARGHCVLIGSCHPFAMRVHTISISTTREQKAHQRWCDCLLYSSHRVYVLLHNPCVYLTYASGQIYASVWQLFACAKHVYGNKFEDKNAKNRTFAWGPLTIKCTLEKKSFAIWIPASRVLVPIQVRATQKCTKSTRYNDTTENTRRQRESVHVMIVTRVFIATGIFVSLEKHKPHANKERWVDYL